MSQLRVSLLADRLGTGPTALGADRYTGKSTANFDASVTPIGVRSSVNLSSITDGGVGIYTRNFTNNLATATYATLATSAGNFAGSADVCHRPYSSAASSQSTSTTNNKVLTDFINNYAVDIGDLA